MSSAAKAKNAFSRLGFFFVAATGGVELRGSSLDFVEFVGEEEALVAANFPPVRLDEPPPEPPAERALDGLAVAGADLVGIAAASDVAGLLGGEADAAGPMEVGFCGAEAVRARALRSRFSLRCARDGFLLTIRRYSKQVRSGKTPAL